MSRARVSMRQATLLSQGVLRRIREMIGGPPPAACRSCWSREDPDSKWQGMERSVLGLLQALTGTGKHEFVCHVQRHRKGQGFRPHQRPRRCIAYAELLKVDPKTVQSALCAAAIDAEIGPES